MEPLILSSDQNVQKLAVGFYFCDVYTDAWLCSRSMMMYTDACTALVLLSRVWLLNTHRLTHVLSEPRVSSALSHRVCPRGRRSFQNTPETVWSQEQWWCGSGKKKKKKEEKKPLMTAVHLFILKFFKNLNWRQCVFQGGPLWLYSPITVRVNTCAACYASSLSSTMATVNQSARKVHYHGFHRETLCFFKLIKIEPRP